jgi:hypothetical protein
MSNKIYDMITGDHVDEREFDMLIPSFSLTAHVKNFTLIFIR